MTTVLLEFDKLQVMLSAAMGSFYNFLNIVALDVKK